MRLAAGVWAAEAAAGDEWLPLVSEEEAAGFDGEFVLAAGSLPTGRAVVARSAGPRRVG